MRVKFCIRRVETKQIWLKNGDLTCTKNKISLLTARTHGKVLLKFVNTINVDTVMLVV
jgi:hypothetical protein